MNRRPRTGLVLALALGVSACAALRGPPPPPWWVQDEDFPRRDENYFYGAGQAPAEISNYFFRRDTARERARGDLARTIDDHAREKLEGDAKAARAVVEEVLPLREIADTYQAPDGSIHVLVRLSRARVETAVSDRMNR